MSHLKTRPNARHHLLLLLSAFLVPLAGCGEKTAEDADDKGPVAGLNPNALVSPDGGPVPGGMPGLLDLPMDNPEPLDPKMVIVTVNGDAITQGDLDETLINMVTRGRRVPERELVRMRKQYGTQAEYQSISHRLLQQAVAAAGISPSDEDVLGEWKQVEAGLSPGPSLEVRLTELGRTPEQFRETLKQKLALELWIATQAKTPAPDEAAVKTYYDTHPDEFNQPEQVSARHVLLKFESNTSAEAKAEIKATLQGYRDELTQGNGRKFADIARAHSACPSAAQGGDLGKFPHGQMVPEFDAVVFDLKVGEVSEIVETQFGYHLIQVDEHQKPGVMPFDKAKEDIAAYLKNQWLGASHKTALEALRKAAVIVHPGDADKPAAAEPVEPAEPKAAESKPVEPKAAESKPVEPKAAESKPVETKK